MKEGGGRDVGGFRIVFGLSTRESKVERCGQHVEQGCDEPPASRQVGESSGSGRVAHGLKIYRGKRFRGPVGRSVRRGAHGGHGGDAHQVSEALPHKSRKAQQASSGLTRLRARKTAFSGPSASRRLASCASRLAARPTRQPRIADSTARARPMPEDEPMMMQVLCFDSGVTSGAF